MTMLNSFEEIKTVEKAMKMGDRFFDDIKDLPPHIALGTICCVIDRYAFLQHIEENEIYKTMSDIHKEVVATLGTWKENENEQRTH